MCLYKRESVYYIDRSKLYTKYIFSAVEAAAALSSPTHCDLFLLGTYGQLFCGSERPQGQSAYRRYTQVETDLYLLCDIMNLEDKW